MDKCSNCGKARDQHNAKDSTCPIGKKHRIYGYTQFQQLSDDFVANSSKIYKRSFDSPEVGCAYIREGMPVYVVDGCVMSGGRVSNWWSYQPINKDGTLGKKSGCYGYEFTEKIKCNVVTKVSINWNGYQDLDL